MKCCLPNGMPTIVIHKSIPKNKCVSAIHTPPQKNQIIFITVDKQPVFDEVSVILTPNGASPTIANLKHWSPKGIPIMVRQRISPPMMYSKKINIPPKIIHIILPKKFIVCAFVFCN